VVESCCCTNFLMAWFGEKMALIQSPPLLIILCLIFVAPGESERSMVVFLFSFYEVRFRHMRFSLFVFFCTEMHKIMQKAM